MKRKTKMMISALSAMLVMVLAVTIVSFSLAGNNDESEAFDEPLLYAEGDQTEKTNIDYIIENSYVTEDNVGEDEADGSEGDPYYRIVEIGSGSSSALQTMCNGDVSAFATYVINGNKTIEQDMKEKTIVYSYYNASTITKDSPELEAIARADFIYVSCDPTNQYTVTNDLGEDLYNFLKNTYLTQRKPLVIDSPEKTKELAGETQGNKVYMSTLATKVFGPKGSRYYTFAWDKFNQPTAEQFLRHQNGSLYLGINGTRKTGNWIRLYLNDQDIDGFSASRMLVISPNANPTENVHPDTDGETITGADYPMAWELLGVADGNPAFPYDDADGDKHYAFGIAGTTMQNYGYNSKYVIPNGMIVDTYQLQPGTADGLLDYDFDKYDMIVIEDGLRNVEISPELYKKFSAAMIGNVTIVYGSDMNLGSGSGSGSGNTEIDTKSTNYRELFYTVANSKDVPTRTNVMVTNRQEFEAIATSNNAETCKVIADLINASSFRGIGGGGAGSSDMYTVLEIQPCYPVDEDIAQWNVVENGKTARRFSTFKNDQIGGFYYTIPVDVVNNKAPEELEDHTEYYNWELSVSKIADVTGIAPNKIQIVHMSSEEFAASKTDVLGTYDLVYIGSDNSALRQSVFDYSAFGNMLQDNWNILESIDTRVQDVAKLPIYTVYSHNGDIARLVLDQMGESGAASVRTGSHITGEQFNDSDKTFVRLNGNDITYNGLENLKAYLNAGMPVVVSKELAEYYDMVETLGYNQNVIDPDSNICKFLKACKDSKNAGKKNILWSFDNKKTVNVSPEAGYESFTMKGYVTVFADQDPENPAEGTRESVTDIDASGNALKPAGEKDNLEKLIKETSKSRLMVSLTNSDKVIYNMYDPKTKFNSGSITYKLNVASFFGLSTNGCSFNFYIDDNGNSKFESSEVQNGNITPAGTATGYDLTYKYPANFYGPFYWKIEVIDSTGNTSSITGLSYVQNQTTEKQRVNVLQIMPDGCAGAQGSASLFFCTVCQQAYKRLDFNPYCNSGDRYSYSSYYRGNFGTAGLADASTGKLIERPAQYEYWPVYKQISDAYGVYMGPHEHTFGIVQYDSGLRVFNEIENGQPLYGMDNWDINLADEVSDLYDFDLDIYYASELEAMSDEIRQYYNLSDADIKANILAFKMSADDDEEDVATLSSILSWSPSESSIPDDVVPVYRGVEGTGNSIVTIKQETVDGVAQYFVDINYSNLTDAQRKAISDLVVSRDYAERANEQWQLYLKESELTAVDADGNRPADAVLTVADTEKDLRGCIEYIIANVGTLGNFGSYDRATTIAEFQRLLDTGYYYDYYNMANNAAQYNMQYTSLGAGKNYEDYYIKYVKAKEREQAYLKEYKRCLRIAGGTDWLLECYDTVVIGAAEEFGGDDITGNALDDLETFVVEGGTTLLFHDTLSKYTDVHAKNLTARLRDDFGMDRNGGVTVQPTLGQYFTDYNTNGTDKYFTTKLPEYSEMSQAISGFNLQSYYSNVAFTDGVMGSSKSTNKTFPYRYADISWSTAANYNQDAQVDTRKGGKFGTDAATQNNKGIVTIFPFTLDEKLNISPTHPQAYALDVEDDNMTVWYSMSAGTNTLDGGSSLFAASPNDGMDNYFIYSYGNVSYCGAGHSKVTGVGKDNNDERRLYINIICNSVRKSINQPAIYVYDYGKDTTGDKVKQDGSNYTIRVDSTSEYPEFSFKAITDQTKKLQSVRIYFDLDYSDTNTTSAYADNENHVLIGQWFAPDVKSGERFDVGRYIAGLLPLTDADGKAIMDIVGYNADGTPITRQATRLKLLPRYFDPYNGEYTYIVIEAKDSDGNIVYQRIKIKLKDYLFNLT